MNKKIIWKFNIIDLLIIAVLLVSLTALVYRVTWGRSEGEQTFALTFECDEAPLALLRDVRSGEECSDGDAGTDLGEVEGIFFEPLEEGSDKGRATINTVAEGSKPENNHGVTIEDTIYLRGKPIDLVIGDTVFKVYISGIKAVK